MATPHPPTCPAVAVAVATTSIEHYYGDDSKVPLAKKNSYIVKVASSAIPGFDVNKTHPAILQVQGCERIHGTLQVFKGDDFTGS